MSDLAGKRLGKYEIRERLGRGGMADVYKAYQPGMNRFVAVKVMHSHLSDSADFIERFKREAQNVGQLRHPHILNVIDFDAEDDLYYMVMEFIKGDTLKAYITEQGSLPPPEAVRITAQIADALDYAHQYGMIHRDIKPANIMFTDTTRRQAVLTDFGIARLLDASGLTMSGAAVGTPAYMSPEGGKGEKVDERSDIYSMGIVLYEMLTGIIPFNADTPYAIILKHIQEPLPDLRHYQQALPDPLERLIFKALAKNPNDRYQTAGELHQALLAIQGDVTASPQTAAPLPPKKPALDNDPTIIGDPSTSTYPSSPTLPKMSPNDATTLMTPKTGQKEGRFGAKVAIAITLLAIMVTFGIFFISDAFSDDDDDYDEDISKSEQGVIFHATTTLDVSEVPPTTTAIEATEAITEAATVESVIIDPTDEVVPPTATHDAPTEIAALSPTATNEEVTPEATEEAILANATLDEITPTETEEVILATATQPIEVASSAFEACLNEGKSLLDQGDVEGAVEAFSCAIEIDPSNTQALSLRASAYSYYDGDLALADLNEAIALEPNNVELLGRRASLLSSIGDLEGALADYDAAIATNKADAYTYAGRGLVQQQLGDYDAALADFTSAIQQIGEPVPSEFYMDRAELNYQQGNYNLALGDYELAIQANPDDPWVYFGYATTSASAGDTDTALTYYTEAIAKDPTIAQAYYERGLIYYQQALYELAIEDFTQAIENNVGDVSQAYDARALSYMNLGQQDKALEDYNRAIEVGEGLSQGYAYQNRGDLYLEQGKYEQAIADYDASEGLGNTNNAYLQRQRGAAHLYSGQYNLALEALNSSLSSISGKQDGYAFVLRGDTYYSLMDYQSAYDDYTAAIKLGSDWVDIYVRRGEMLYYLGRYDEALDDINQALNLDDTYWQAYDVRGQLQNALGNYAEAVNDFDTVIDHNSATARTFMWRAHAYWYLNDLDAAQADLEIALGLDDTESYIYVLLGYVALGRQDDATALEHFQTAVQLGTTDLSAYVQLAEIYQRQDDLISALAQYQQLLLIAPDQYWVHNGASKFYYLLGQYAAAIDEAQTALNLGLTGDPYVFSVLGGGHTALGNYTEAILAYTNAIELEPENGEFYIGRAYAYLATENYEEALSDSDQAISLGQETAYIYETRGIAQLNLNDLASAKRSLQRAIAIDPNYPSAYANLAYVYELEGNVTQAIRNYETYLQLMNELGQAPSPQAVSNLEALRGQ